jgi:hypothetical protein
VLLELSDRRIVYYHEPGRMPARADDFPANLQPMSGMLLSDCRAAAQSNKRTSLDAALAFCLHCGRHWRRASEPEW